jgi:adenylate cyclase
MSASGPAAARPATLPAGVDLVRRVPLDVLADDAPHARDPVAWLLNEARTASSVAAIIDGLAQRLRKAAVPLTRFTIHIGTVHPQLLGYGCNWSLATNSCAEFEVRHAALDEDSYRRSPMRLVIEERVIVRRDPRRIEAQAEFALMRDLDAERITDYVARPLDMLGTGRSAVTYATDSPLRFDDVHLALIESTLPALLLHVDARIMRSVAGNVLDAYIGPRAGARVLRGEIQRGQGERIDAVIWISDLRDYTALSDRLPDTQTIRVLNAYFEQLVGAIRAHGGEVLKFIGDGLLAIFPVDSSAPGAAADAALAAATAGLAGLERLNAERGRPSAPDGDWPALRVGIALHRGEVFFGNIGAPTRVDFTVIGAAVNLTARVEPLTKALGTPLLVTEAVAKLASEPLLPLGTHSLRGLSTPIAVFAPAA